MSSDEQMVEFVAWGLSFIVAYMLLGLAVCIYNKVRRER
jgi:hypothetical protein